MAEHLPSKSKVRQHHQKKTQIFLHNLILSFLVVLLLFFGTWFHVAHTGLKLAM